MPLSDDYKTEKELATLSDALNETIDLFINDDNLATKKRGFVLFIVDFNTGVCRMNTSCVMDDVTEMLRHWVNHVDEKKKKIVS